MCVSLVCRTVTGTYDSIPLNLHCFVWFLLLSEWIILWILPIEPRLLRCVPSSTSNCCNKAEAKDYWINPAKGICNSICWKLIHVLSTCNFTYHSNVKDTHTHTHWSTDERKIYNSSLFSALTIRRKNQTVPDQDRLTRIKKYIIQ